MPNIGPLELLFVLIIALVLLGPKKLPAAAQSLGRSIDEFRRGLSERRDDESAGPVPPQLETQQSSTPAAETTGGQSAPPGAGDPNKTASG